MSSGCGFLRGRAGRCQQASCEGSEWLGRVTGTLGKSGCGSAAARAAQVRRGLLQGGPSEGDPSPPPPIPLLFALFLILVPLLSFSSDVMKLFSSSLCPTHPHTDPYPDSCPFWLGSCRKASAQWAKVLRFVFSVPGRGDRTLLAQLIEKESSVNSSDCLRAYARILWFVDAKLLGLSPVFSGNNISYSLVFGVVISLPFHVLFCLLGRLQTFLCPDCSLSSMLSL